jgi:hypothetical protein
LISALIAFSLYVSIKRTNLSKKAILLSIAINLILISLLVFYKGADKIKSDIVRVIHNSMPKKAAEVYPLLFKKPVDGCVNVINFKDQVIPKIDCCIWMELKLCPVELNRILALKKYQKTRLNKSDSLSFLHLFTDRPVWWTPQILGDSLTKYTFKFNQDNEQTLMFGNDSSHIYLCDQAL